MIAKRVVFEGRVQGVGFRYTTKDLARGFDVCGLVKNLPDGTVEMRMMGEKEELDAFLKEITEESAVAHHIQTTRTESIPLLEGIRGFSIEK